MYRLEKQQMNIFWVNVTDVSAKTNTQQTAVCNMSRVEGAVTSHQNEIFGGVQELFITAKIR